MTSIVNFLRYGSLLPPKDVYHKFNLIYLYFLI